MVKVAAVQMASGEDFEDNLARAEGLVRRAAEDGAQIVLLPEMFSGRFFSMHSWNPDQFAHARPADEHPVLKRMAPLAAELGVVLPVSFFERANNAYFNSIMIIDADGRGLGVYRKSHIPLGPPNCFEKYYFNQGDTGFRVWRTAHGVIGTAVCWDQWFPEAARIMALKGAEVLFYPSGIGSDCHDHWQRVMQGHAAANMVPLVASNRIGTEPGVFGGYTYWGRSFIANVDGAILTEAGGEEGFVAASFDPEANRAAWGLFRDRRLDLYAPLLTTDGEDGRRVA